MNDSTISSRRRWRGPGERLRSAVGAFLVLAVAALGLPGAADAADADCTGVAPDNRCIPGGGNARLDCLQEWLIVPDTARNYKGVPRNKLDCFEGDPNCDADPDLTNGICVFNPRICINNQDPRLTRCEPSDVTTFEFDQPDADSSSAVDTLNRDAIEFELGYGGLGPYIVQDKQLVYLGEVNPAPNLCSNPIPLAVPMKVRRDGSWQKARRRFIVRATSSDGRVDKDTFTFTCLPSRCGDGWKGPKEQCDDGNRDNGDGCDQGCYLEPPPTPTPVPTPSPEPTETPIPTETPEPTDTPEPTQSPEPTPTPVPTPTPTPPVPTLGVWSFGVATGGGSLCPGTAIGDGSQIKSSGMPGSNTTGGGLACSITRGNFSANANFQLVGGAIDGTTGIAPIQFNGARVVRVQEPSASSNNWICLRVESNGPGWVDCNGGSDARLQATVNSNTVNPPAPPSWDPAWITEFDTTDSGVGAARIPVSVRLQQIATTCPDPSDASWSSIDPVTSILTTAQAVSRIDLPRSCPDPVSIASCPTGSSFQVTMPSTSSLNCGSWTTQTNKTFQAPLFFLDSDFGSGNIGDMALVARLRTSP